MKSGSTSICILSVIEKCLYIFGLFFLGVWIGRDKAGRCDKMQKNQTIEFER